MPPKRPDQQPPACYHDTMKSTIRRAFIAGICSLVAFSANASGNTVVVLEIEGETWQGRLFGESLRLHRRISTHMGARSLTIEDRVVNEGFRPTPLAVLYHCNLGFPVASPDSELLVSSRKVWPRDDAAQVGFDAHRKLEPPQDGYAEQVFFHEPQPDARGLSSAAVVNRRR